jgi:hypothetical protein
VAPNELVPLALAAFVPAVVACFLWLTPTRAVTLALVGGWLLLPSFDGWFDPPFLHTKRVFVPAIVLGVSALLDGRSWRRLQPAWVDAPVAVLCAAPFAASLSNDLGAYDGLQASFEAAMTWGAPYLLGRAYLDGRAALDQLAVTLVGAALAYAPAVALEARMSPQLHRLVYGFHPFDFVQAVRGAGFRPNVFMAHGLMLAMFMATAALLAYWLWRTGARRRIARIPSGWAAAILVAATMACRSAGAAVLLVAGIAALEATRATRHAVAIAALAAVPPLYCAARISGWTGASAVEISARVMGDDRSGSLAFRLANEDLLIEKALHRPWVGWGRWGRSRVYEEDSGRDVTVTDGLWIITLGVAGFSALVALWLMLALPPLAVLAAYPARWWSDPRLAAPAALASALLLWVIDDIPNGMVTPVFPAIAGALVSFTRARAGVADRAAVARRGAATWSGTHV